MREYQCKPLVVVVTCCCCDQRICDKSRTYIISLEIDISSYLLVSLSTPLPDKQRSDASGRKAQPQGRSAPRGQEAREEKVSLGSKTPTERMIETCV